jgi:hypothetical protein
LLLQAFSEGIRYAGCTSIKEMAITLAAGGCANREKKIRTVNSRYVLFTEVMAQPYQRHPIRGSHTTSVHAPLERMILLAFHHSMDSTDINVVVAAAFNPRCDPVRGSIKGQGADPNSKNVHPSRQGGDLLAAFQ